MSADKARLIYGFWIACGPDDSVPSGLDARIWKNSSPKRALEIAIAAAQDYPASYMIVEGWNEETLNRVYVGARGYSESGPAYLDYGMDVVPFQFNLAQLRKRFGGQEYGWHLFSTDQEDP